MNIGRTFLEDRNPTPAAAFGRRRFLSLAGSAALVGLPNMAVAGDEDVTLAIFKDFGRLDIPFGQVEIEMPDFSDSGKSVPLSVNVPCTMTGLDYPETVAVYAARNPRPRIARAHFTPLCAQPRFSTRVRIDSYQDVTIVVRMASGEVFKGVRKVDVTYGACEEAIASEQFPPGWSPRIRIAAPETVAAGEFANIRTIIGHPMETGFRHNAQGLIVPVRIAEWFRCFANGELAFSVKLEPAISANPYFEFFLKVEKDTDLYFEWVDTTGDIYQEQAFIKAG